MSKIFPLTKDDYNDLSLFLAGFKNGSKHKEYWLNRFKLWWDNNPAFTNHSERGWIIKEKGEIVGYYGVIPSKFQFLGEGITALNATTWMVLPGYRNNSLKLLFNLIAAAKHTILFSTTPNRSVIEARKSLNFEIIPRDSKDKENKRVSLIVLNFDKIFRYKFRNNLFLTSLIKILAPILSVIQSVLIRNLKKTDLANAKELEKADHLFDQLWEKTKDVYMNTNVRTSDVINWYCFENKDFEKKLFGYYENNQLAGYIICRTRDETDYRMLECIDLWFDPTKKYVISPLINYVREYAQKNFIDMIWIPHFTDELRAYFKKLGLISVNLGQRKEFFKAKKEIRDQINDKNSYFVSAQGDYGL